MIEIPRERQKNWKMRKRSIQGKKVHTIRGSQLSKTRGRLTDAGRVAGSERERAEVSIIPHHHFLSRGQVLAPLTYGLHAFTMPFLYRAELRAIMCDGKEKHRANRETRSL